LQPDGIHLLSEYKQKYPWVLKEREEEGRGACPGLFPLQVVFDVELKWGFGERLEGRMRARERVLLKGIWISAEALLLLYNSCQEEQLSPFSCGWGKEFGLFL